MAVVRQSMFQALAALALTGLVISSAQAAQKQQENYSVGSGFHIVGNLGCLRQVLH